MVQSQTTRQSQSITENGHQSGRTEVRRGSVKISANGLAALWRVAFVYLLTAAGCGEDAENASTINANLCAACDAHSDCGAGLCLTSSENDGRFCGQDCERNADCPGGFACEALRSESGVSGRQCVPSSGSCADQNQPVVNAGQQEDRNPSSNSDQAEDRGAEEVPNPASDNNAGDDRATSDSAEDDNAPRENGLAPTPSDCDPSFRGPFCENDRIIGFEASLPSEPTLEEVRAYNVAAVNHIRSLTCLPQVTADTCLDDIAVRALEIGGFHTYFIENCMNAEYGFGANCECNWSQENIGAAFGTRRTVEDGIHVPLCAMMEEPYGQGHRSNIENPLWVRLGVGIDWNDTGASWHHEFGCDASLDACPR
jgi:hypothetical protein